MVLKAERPQPDRDRKAERLLWPRPLVGRQDLANLFWRSCPEGADARKISTIVMEIIWSSTTFARIRGCGSSAMSRQAFISPTVAMGRDGPLQVAAPRPSR